MQIKRVNEQKDIAHIGFEIGMLMKGINGLSEIIGGILLLFLSPERLNKIIRFITQYELSEDPNDFVMNHLLALSQSFSISTIHFGVFYLISHGIVKCMLILLLWRKKLWAYPLTIVSLILFITYQVYRYYIHASVFLVFLTIFDMIMIALTFIEYKKMKMKL